MVAAAAFVAGAVGGASLALSADRILPDPTPAGLQGGRPGQLPGTPDPTVVVEGKAGTGAMLVWAPGNLPRRIVAAAEDVVTEEAVTVVVGGIDWIVRTSDQDGRIIDDPPSGAGIPFDVARIDPRGYSAFAPASESDLISSLRPGQILLSETGARLRRGDVGMEIAMDDGRVLTVTGVVSDEAAGGYEGLVSGGLPPSWQRVYPFMLVRVGGGAERERVERTLRELGNGVTLRIRGSGETPYFRYGDAVLPQMIAKDVFGEFWAMPVGGNLKMQPRWHERNIVTRTVPLLGDVTCHRLVFPQMIAALSEVRDSGLERTIDPGDFGGCYSPRFISGAPGGRLSSHAWGMSVDIDVGENPFGAKPRQDRRVVEIFERHGFTWGGRWLIPDGMHFEWSRFP